MSISFAAALAGTGSPRSYRPGHPAAARKTPDGHGGLVFALAGLTVALAAQAAGYRPASCPPRSAPFSSARSWSRRSRWPGAWPSWPPGVWARASPRGWSWPGCRGRPRDPGHRPAQRARRSARRGRRPGTTSSSSRSGCSPGRRRRRADRDRGAGHDRAAQPQRPRLAGALAAVALAGVAALATQGLQAGLPANAAYPGLTAGRRGGWPGSPPAGPRW